MRDVDAAALGGWLSACVEAVEPLVDSSMTVREVLAVGVMMGCEAGLARVSERSGPVLAVNGRFDGSDDGFHRGYAAGAGLILDDVDALLAQSRSLLSDNRVWSRLRHPAGSSVDGRTR
jgi:hypothetical protein